MVNTVNSQGVVTIQIALILGVSGDKMGWFKDWKEKRKLKKYMKRTPEEEYAIYKRRLLAGETEISARAGLKHIKKK